MPWLVRTVRFTSFLTPDAALDGNLWQTVLGSEPDETVHQRPAGLRQDRGTYEDASVTLTVQPGRVDLLFGPIETPAPDWETLGEFPASIQRYIDVLLRWIASPTFPATRRLALGVHLVEPTESAQTGYARLRDFVDAVPEGEASDFLYQVNRYRQSAAMAELRVNRLAKWSVARVQLFQIEAGAGMARQGKTLHFVAAELDISTSGDFAGQIPAPVVAPVFNDLIAAASEVAAGEQGLRGVR